MQENIATLIDIAWSSAIDTVCKINETTYSKMSYKDL